MISIILLMIIPAVIFILMYKEYITWSFNYHYVNVIWNGFLLISLSYILSTSISFTTTFFTVLLIAVGSVLSFHPAFDDDIIIHGFGEIPNTTDQQEAEA